MPWCSRVLLVCLQAADDAKEGEEAGDSAAAMDVDGPAAEEEAQVSQQPLHGVL
jgi:hypothetical protein